VTELFLFDAHELHVDSQVGANVSSTEDHGLLKERGHEMSRLGCLLVRAICVIPCATDLLITFRCKLKECHQVGIPNGHRDEVFATLNIHKNCDSQVL